MEDFTRIETTLSISARKIINQFLLDNKTIETEIEQGVKRAFERIDIPDLIENQVRRVIEDSIKQSGDWGKIREIVKVKMDLIIEEYVDNAINKFRKDFPQQ